MNISPFLNPKSPVTITVLGDIMLDSYVSGGVSRISPEAPVPVLNHSNVREVVGGSGNVAANLAAMGAEVQLISLTGQDATHDRLVSICDDFNICTRHIVRSATRQTTIKTRFMSGTQQILRLDHEDTTALNPDEKADVVAALKAALANTDCLVMSDYNKGVFKNGVAEAAIALAKMRGIPVIVDPKGQDYSKYQGATALTPNRKELGEAVGRSVRSNDEVIAAARELIERYDFAFLCATRSEDGMSIICRDAVHHIPTYAKEVFDVSGAGDTVVAALALGLARGLSRNDAAYIANVAAGLAVSKQGTARISINEIREEMRQRKRLERHNEGISTLAEVKRLREGWAEQGLSVGMTNGCFDVLHIGHVTSLSKARAQCDRLILALNSDASVRRLKGQSRPINTAENRAGVLGALRDVDAICVFDEDTPLDVISALLPDRLFKGADYKVEDVVGGREVMEAGGEVILIDFVDGHSTTGTLEKLAQIDG